MDYILICLTLIVIFVVLSFLWFGIQEYLHNTFGDTTEKRIASGGMKICPHCDSVITPRGSTCPVCQKKLS